MKKRLQTISLILVFLLLAVSCGNNDSSYSFESDSIESNIGVEGNFCSLVIECKTVLDHLDRLAPSVAERIPSDGVIFPQSTVSFESGETVANLLRRVCDENGIALETSGVSGSIYVEGIGHLYEFDCGDGSGWMYTVNSEFPNYGCDSRVLVPGDIVEWRYSCDFGNDIGCMIPD